jgi:CRP/FNR family cyclic AMP-dependent transcriptional regulator
VKKLLNRLTGVVASARGESLDEDSTYYSTVFLDRTDEPAVKATWSERSATIDAQPFDARRGSEMFARLWQADTQVVSLTDGELDRLGGYLRFVSVAEGREVIGQDEQGDYLVVVLDGTIAVDRLQPWGGRARLAEARAGDLLGEMSLLDAGARFSACTTLTPTVLAVLDAQRLQQMVATEPRLALSVVASLARRLSLRLRQVSARLSALLSAG